MPFVLAPLLLSSGLALESYPLPEARVVAELPAQPELVAAGPMADVPQSVQGFQWRAQGSGIQVTVAYDKWRSAHFSPQISLERLARHTYGRLDGFSIQEAEVGGLSGALLTLDTPQGAATAVWNVKSGTEAWQITVKPTSGHLSREMLEDLRNGLKIDAQPEPEGLYNQWGEPSHPDISSKPIPSPLAWNKTLLGGLIFESPMPMVPFVAERRSGETAALNGLREWHGAAGDVEVFASMFDVKENLGVDLGAWGASFSQMMERDGLRSWQPKLSTFQLAAARTRHLTGEVSRDGQKWFVEIILATHGQKAWAVQIRVRDTAEGRDAMSRIKSSLTLRV